MKQDYDSNSTGDKNQQRNQELYIAWYSDVSIFLRNCRRQRTSSDTREHREPAVGDRQWSFMNKEHQSANAGEKRPDPSEDTDNYQAGSRSQPGEDECGDDRDAGETCNGMDVHLVARDCAGHSVQGLRNAEAQVRSRCVITRAAIPLGAINSMRYARTAGFAARRSAFQSTSSPRR
jgi:hypothetical protein